jgi:uncharacterized protein (DUF58 family)
MSGDAKRRRLSFFGRFWQERLTLSGQILVGLLLICLPSLTATDSGLLLLFSSASAMLIVNVAVGWLYRPQCQPTVTLPARCMRGALCTGTGELLTEKGRGSWELQWQLVDVPESWTVSVAASRIERLRSDVPQSIRFTVQPHARGVYRWPDLEVTSTFPLNLARFQHRMSLNRTIHVYPAFDRLRAVPAPLARVLTSPEVTMTQTRSGGSSDYLGSREYQAGLPVRRWDFRSWARLGRPVVREYSEAQERSFGVLLDNRVMGGEPAGERFERLLEFAAAVLDLLDERRENLCWLATTQAFYRLGGTSRESQRRIWLDVLAALQPDERLDATFPKPPIASSCHRGIGVLAMSVHPASSLADLQTISRQRGAQFVLLSPRASLRTDQRLDVL